MVELIFCGFPDAAADPPSVFKTLQPATSKFLRLDELSICVLASSVLSLLAFPIVLVFYKQ